MNPALATDIDQAGGRDKLAAALGVHPNTVRYWEANPMPIRRAQQLAEITRRPWQEYRPDLFPVSADAGA
jgi:DNA-binding transcriptional regulator YdaS (Cro superfamily)